MFALLCVIDQVDHLDAVLAAWKRAGIRGVTVIESTGMFRVIQAASIPMRYSFGASKQESGNLTLFAVVNNEELIQACLVATENVVGDFNQPNTGIFVSWPLGFSKGANKQNNQNEEDVKA